MVGGRALTHSEVLVGIEERADAAGHDIRILAFVPRDDDFEETILRCENDEGSTCGLTVRVVQGTNQPCGYRVYVELPGWASGTLALVDVPCEGTAPEEVDR